MSGNVLLVLVIRVEEKAALSYSTVPSVRYSTVVLLQYSIRTNLVWYYIVHLPVMQKKKKKSRMVLVLARYRTSTRTGERTLEPARTDEPCRINVPSKVTTSYGLLYGSKDDEACAISGKRTTNNSKVETKYFHSVREFFSNIEIFSNIRA